MEAKNGVKGLSQRDKEDTLSIYLLQSFILYTCIFWMGEMQRCKKFSHITKKEP